MKIKGNVPNELKIKYNGILYYPKSYTIEFDKFGNIIHTAILHDLNSNSVISCDLKDIEMYQKL